MNNDINSSILKIRKYKKNKKKMFPSSYGNNGHYICQIVTTNNNNNKKQRALRISYNILKNYSIIFLINYSYLLFQL